MTPKAPPRFASELRPSPYRDVARARWVAEQHFEYEASNVSDIILLSMSSKGPLSTAVMLPDETGRLTLRQCRNLEEQRAFYDRNRSKRQLATADVTTATASDWYGFVAGTLMHKDMSSGKLTPSRFVGVLPITEGEDTISGELGFGLTEVQVAAMAGDSLARRRAFTRAEQECVAALNGGDLARLGRLYADDACFAERDYPGTAQVALQGRGRVASYYQNLMERFGKPTVAILARNAEDWYSFAELLWEFQGKDRSCRFRTAHVNALDADGRIAFQLGYGTAMEFLA